MYEIGQNQLRNSFIQYSLLYFDSEKARYFLLHLRFSVICMKIKSQLLNTISQHVYTNRWYKTVAQKMEKSSLNVAWF